VTRTLLAAALLLTAPRLLLAGTISIETSINTEVGDTVRTRVSLRNLGTDAAHDVVPRARFGEQERTGALESTLPPRGSHEWTFEFPRPERKGRYALLATVAYTDPGFRASSAVSAQLVDVGTKGAVFPLRLRGRIDPIDLETDGELVVSAEPEGTTPQGLVVGLLAPDELGGWREVSRVEPSAGKPSKITIPIHNNGALPGSNFPVYAIFRGEDADHVTAAMLVGTVSVSAALTSKWQAYLPYGAVLLAALYAAVEISLRVRGRRGAAPQTSQPETPPRRT
jgi:hypothetical protein